MRWKLRIKESQVETEVDLLTIENDQYTFIVGGKHVTLKHPICEAFSLRSDECDIAFETWTKSRWRGIVKGRLYEIEPQTLSSQSSQKQNEIRSQMPGRILRVLVEEGQLIQPGEPLLIIEAMKMENEIRATGKAIVKGLFVSVGQGVEAGTVLLRLEPHL